MSRPFVGRERPLAALRAGLTEALAGRGSLVLVAGEAGIGKTRLVHEAFRGFDLAVVTDPGARGDGLPFGPIVRVLRRQLRRAGYRREALGALAEHLHVLIPELGSVAAAGTDRGTLFQSIVCAFLQLAADGVGGVFLDDLQWADEATFELLAALDEGVSDAALAVVGAYRSEELALDHPLRRLRTDLRRRARLREVVLEPLSLDEGVRFVMSLPQWVREGDQDAAVEPEPGAHRLPSPVVAPDAVRLERLYRRARGIPFYLEELAGAAQHEDSLPDSIRDAVRLRLQPVSDWTRTVLDAASVLGSRFDRGHLAELLASPDTDPGGASTTPAAVRNSPAGDLDSALAEAADHGLVRAIDDEANAFRHDLIREAVYAGLAPARRRILHGRAARLLDARSAPAQVLAAHWFAAGDQRRARLAFAAAAEVSCTMHAYRDAVRQSLMALDLWPRDDDARGRTEFLDRLGHCAELSGELEVAVHAWQEAARHWEASGDLFALAETQRRLAAAHALAGTWEEAMAAHDCAAEAYAGHGLAGEAAAERLLAADLLEGAGRRRRALSLAHTAREEARRALRPDLEARAMGLVGQLRVELGERESGLDTIRDGLRRALALHLVGPAGELHYRLAWALGEVGAYHRARDEWSQALEYCRMHGLTETEQLCLACYAGTLVEVGEWRQADSVCHSLLAGDVAPVIRVAAACILGVLEALRGRAADARRHLGACETALPGLPSFVGLELTTQWGFAVVDAHEGLAVEAARRIRVLRQRWAATDDLYYIVHPLRWAATFLACHGFEADARGCADDLANVAAAKGSPEAIAALAHGLGECALLDTDVSSATTSFERSSRVLARIGLPFQEAHTRTRLAAALVAAGETETAARHLARAYRIAARLGADPLAHEAAAALRVHGRDVAALLGSRAAHRIAHGGLTPREREVLALASSGLTNRAIARTLGLSHRTVEMHVGNALGKLGCRNRTEAARRAHDLGILS